MKRMIIFSLTAALVVLWVCAANVGQVSAQVSDDFEDGSIDANKWVVGGRRGSYTPANEGNWTWTHTEVTSSDGYLQMNLQGPTSGNSYGAVAWTRGTYDFNDGAPHTQNFTWNVEVPLRGLLLLVQIADGDNVPTFAESNWINDWLLLDYPGTTNLLRSWESPNNGFYENYYGTSPKQTWSITTDPAGMARLYKGPDGTGPLVLEKSLDLSQHWYTRFAVWSGTSAGHPAGDGSLNLYSYSAVVPEPSTLILLAMGAIGLLAYARRRRRVAREGIA